MDCSDIWFSDGSIVLQAEDTQFRVHKMVLARHSEVFSDILDLPQPDDEPTVEGCPIVILQDSAEDIRHMLLALYDKCYNQHGPIPFDVVAAMLRLGRKYGIAILWDEGLARLKMEIPSTREGIKHLQPNLPCTHIEQEPRLLYKLINLAREIGIQTVLPAAFCMCLFDHVSQTDPGYLLVRERDFYDVLPDDTKCRITLGGHKLMDLYNVLFQWVEEFAYASPVCGCRDRVSTELFLLHQLWRSRPVLYRLFEDWDSLVQSLRVDDEDPENLMPSLETRMCSTCYEKAKRNFIQDQPIIWDQLPSAFGLPDWDHLEDFELKGSN